MKKLLVAVVLTAGAWVGCRSTVRDQNASRPTASERPLQSCESAVRLEPSVSVMFRNEWMSGQLALTVCRNSEAHTSDLAPFVKWLGEEAIAGRIRRCGTPSAKEPITERERREAESRLPGVKDWCLAVIADI